MPRKSALKCYFGCTPFVGKAHHFPSPNYPSSEKFAQWKMVLSEMDKAKGDNYIHNNIRICDNHFEKFYLTNIGRLTKNAVPTLNIASTSISTSNLNYIEANVTSDVPENTRSHGSTFKDNEPICGDQPAATPLSYDVVNKGSTSKKDVPCMNPTIANHNIQATVKSCRNIHVMNKKIFNQNTQLKVKLLKLREKCKNLHQKVRQASKISQNKAFLRAAEKLPEPAAIFTGMQLRNISTKSRGRRFTNKEKILCLTIFKQSQKAYKLLQNLFELPSKRTIQTILSKVKIVPGINDVVIKHLKKAVKKLPFEKKLCTLIFDEVALSPGLYYNKTSDEIIGFEDFGLQKTPKIADHALVFMIKGLKGKYKQPIGFTFCQSATKSAELKNLLVDALKAVESTGLIVIATVCDQSPINMKVIKSLLNDTKRKYLTEGKEVKSLAFECNGRKIFPVFDPPHLLKGLRNNLLTKDLRYIENGVVKFAKWEHLEMLLEADPGEDDIRLINKLTTSHVVKEKIPKMKVKYAAQVFSQRVSAAMRYLASHDILPKECLGTADLLLLVDKLFDSFNGHSYENHEKIYKSALKRNSPHFKLWEEVLPIIRSMQFKVHKKLSDGTTSIKFEQVPSIKNFISNINVYKEMFLYLNKQHKVSSLLTRNINQDPLENFFCNIRSNGVRNTSPTCSQFTAAFKTLLINNLTSPHSVGANCEQDNNKSLKSLKSLLKFKKNEREKPSDNINVDSVLNRFMQTSDTTSNTITKEAKRYVAGYIIKKTLQKMSKKCHACRMNLVSTTPPSNKDYILLRDYTKKSLNYPSEALCEFVDEVCMIIQAKLNEEPHQKNLKFIIKQISNIFCNMCALFSCTSHRTEVINIVLDNTINIIINSWCTNVNRLLKGKSNICNSDKTKIQALNYYKTHNKRKK